jgi:hypothetical protein
LKNLKFRSNHTGNSTQKCVLKSKEKEKMTRNKTATSIAIILILTFAVPIVALPAANAHTPPWTIISYAYIEASPNPVGVGQAVAIVMWIDTPLVSAAVTNDIRRHDYTLTITKPDGTTQTQHWAVVSDTTGLQSYYYTPDQAGNYTLKFDYPAQTYTWSGDYQNDTFTAASKTTTLTVQQEPIPAPKASYPLPSEYWTRPIEGQNSYWYAISSNWLGRPYITAAGAGYGMPGGTQLDGTAPNSAHIMWSKPIQFGGVVGGSDFGVPGNTFYTGGSYNVRYTNPLVMYGTLYYQEPYGNSGGGGDYVAVDLRTGKERWRINASATGTSLVPSFGYLYDYESPNQHGVLPNGLLVAATSVTGQGTVWRAYDPRTGVLTTMNITNVPSGAAIAGPQGEILRYVLTNIGNATNPNWRLLQWNSSRIFGGGSGLAPANWYSGTANASLPSCYDWNISLTLGPGTWSFLTDFLGVYPLVSLNNIMLLVQGGFGGHPGDFSAVLTTAGANITALNLNASKGAVGQVLWTKYYPPAPGNNTRGIEGWDPNAGVFIFWDKENKVISGYSLANGDKLWGTEPVNDWMFLPNSVLVAYGKAYWTGYGGITYCYDVKNGSLLWTYGNGGPGNSTSSGLETPWGRYPTFVDVIADGKIYLCTTEHSPNTPLYKDSLFRCINATDGTEIWTLMGYATQMYGGSDLVAEGFFAFLNCYDMQIYCVGKGPSATTVQAPMTAIAAGNSVVIQGTVTDVSAGTEQDVIARRFPNGVPAVSDASMGAWMEYVYMQKPRPTTATGVTVTIDAVDPNGNFIHLGTATSDTSSLFHYAWKTPGVPGEYTIIATFAGSEGYWSSYAETAMVISEAPPSPTPTPAAAPTPPYEMYTIGTGIAIIIAIAIATILLLRKRP